MNQTAYDALQPDARKVLDYLMAGGTLTEREALLELNVGRLAARVFDLRAALGTEVIAMDREKNSKGGTHGRYRWTGPREIQLELAS